MVDFTPGFNLHANFGDGIPFISKGNGSSGLASGTGTDIGDFRASLNAQANAAGAKALGDASAALSGYRPQVLDASTGSTGAYYGTAGGSGGSAYDPQAAQVYQSQIDQANAQLGSYDGLQNQLLANVGNSYNQGLKSLNDSNAIATRNYNTQRDNTVQENVDAKQQIDSSVRNNTNALQRLLGIAGSGNSSAADYANYAAARQGTQQRTQVNNNYGKNLQALDTSFGDTQNQYQNSLASLADQRKSQENSAISSINNNRATLLSTLAQLRTAQAGAQGQSAIEAQAAANPYQQQIQAINAQAAGLAQNYANPTINTQGVAFAAPELASYATDGAVAGGGNTNAVTDTVSPLYYNLLNKDKATGALVA